VDIEPCDPGRIVGMLLVGAREERLAQNEALFREVNERVTEVATHFIEGGRERSEVAPDLPGRREARGGCSTDRTRRTRGPSVHTGQRPGMSAGASAARPDNKGIRPLPSKGAVPGRWFPRAAVASSSIVPAPRPAQAQGKYPALPGSTPRVSRTAGAAEGTAACADRGEEETFGSPPLPFRTELRSTRA
jgi:hypothetical protein